MIEVARQYKKLPNEIWNLDWLSFIEILNNNTINSYIRDELENNNKR